MLALAHVLVREGLHDEAFLARCCHGAERFIAYVLGESDGVAKTPEWAAERSGHPGATTSARSRARWRRRARSSRCRTRCSAREHGEQPVWAALALAALLGQIGLPGGGFGHGYGSMGDLGSASAAIPLPMLPEGRNPVRELHPGRAHRRSAAAAGRDASTTTARAHATPTSASCTGPAATRSTTTRT